MQDVYKNIEDYNPNKQTKKIEDQGKKQIDALESLKPSDKQLP